MRHYELVVVLSPILSPEESSGASDRMKQLITEHGGEITQEDPWGMRRLAYPIRKEGQTFLEGDYHLTRFSTDTVVPPDLETHLKMSEIILRYLLVRSDGVLPTKPVAQQAVATQAEEPAAAEAEAEEPTVAEIEEPEAEAPTVAQVEEAEPERAAVDEIEKPDVEEEVAAVEEPEAEAQAVAQVEEAEPERAAVDEIEKPDVEEEVAAVEEPEAGKPVAKKLRRQPPKARRSRK